MYSNKNVVKSKSKKVPLLLVALAVAAVVGVALYYKYYRRPTAHTMPVASGPTAAKVKQDSDVNIKTKQTAINNTVTSPTKEPNQAATDTPAPTSDDILLSAKQESNGTVTVTAKLTNVSSGSCSLTITNGARTTTKTAPVIYQPEFSTCAGFSVPVSEVGAGSWSLALDVTTPSKTISKTIKLETH